MLQIVTDGSAMKRLMFIIVTDSGLQMESYGGR